MNLHKTVSCLTFIVYVALERKIWTANACKSYLRTEGFNQKCIDKIMDYSTNYIAYEHAKQNCENDPITWNMECD